MDPITIAGIASAAGAAGAGIIDTGINTWQKYEDRKFNAKEAQKQRDWEEYMSNSAYTRAVKDMQNAGLNPAAMYGGTGGSASTPGGASASGNIGNVSNIMSGIAQVINSAGTMASTMNSKNEQAAKLQAYERANDMLRTASNLAARYQNLKNEE